MNIVHIGLERTGNSTIQNAIFSQLDSFTYIGANNDAYPSRLIEELIVRISAQDSLDYSEIQAEGLLQKIRGGIDKPAPVLIASERFSLEGGADRRLVAERLHKLFAPAKILIILRSQTSIVQAQYLKYLEGLRGRIGSFDSWLQQTYGDFEFPAAFRLGLDYEPLVRLYENVFGSENLVLLPSELMYEDFSTSQSGLAELLGIPVQVVQEMLRRKANDQRVGQRLMLAHRIQDLLPAETSLPALGRKLLPLTIYDPIRRFFLRGPRIQTPELPERWRKRIFDVCAEGNAELERRTGLSLGALGYPVASQRH